MLTVFLACLAAATLGGAPLPQPPARLLREDGTPARAATFPIAVWLQNPSNAERYKAAGFNLYVGLWQGPTEEQLAALKRAGMPVICEQNAVGLAHRDDPIIAGWMHGDEPDNAQPVVDPKTGERSWGPCIPPARIVEDVRRLRAADPTRPVLLNLGQGVANEAWVGRGPGAKLSDYEEYVKGCSIVSFDVYPVAGIGRPDGGEYLWFVPKGVRRLVTWTSGRKPVWCCIECTHIDSDRKATPEQVRAEVWMALVSGARGLIYFVHEFKPRFNEHALLDDPAMLAAVTELNARIQRLAPVLNAPSGEGGVTVATGRDEAPVEAVAKRHEGWTYVLAAAMRNRPAKAVFHLKDVRGTRRVEVVDEGRTLVLRGGRFEDAFSAHASHVYRVR